MLVDTSSPQSNLPAQPSSFIGREHELAEIARLLRAQRLVTLTGPGGTGKTRLALRAADAEVGHFTDGVWLVELAPLTRPELVVESIAQVLRAPETGDLSPIEGLVASLSAKRALLVLDNCEHLLDECARVVAALLARCPMLSVLATSREPLAIAGEWALRVPPLRVPEPSDTLDDERLMGFDGIRLFVERARAAEPSFQLSDVTAPSVVEICRRLDGIPLALELAAMRVRGMGVAYLRARLDDRFRLLTGGNRAGEARQQTLNAMVDWSYSLLSERERIALRRLSVFAGDFSPEAMEAVCADTPDGRDGASGDGGSVLDDLARLVDKSLVQLEHETGFYRLLETIRLYSREQLARAGETNYVSRQHFVYYLHLAEDGVALLGGADQEAWYARIEREHDNFRAALAWAIQEKRSDESARMALALWRFWRDRTYQFEGMRWLEQALALDAIRPLPEALRPRLFNALGELAHITRSYDRATAYHAEALRLWTAANDQAGMARAHLDIGWQHFDEVRLDEASQSAAHALAIAEAIGDERLIASALLLRGVVSVESQRLDGLIPSLERALAIWRALGDIDSQASTIAMLGAAHQRSGDFEASKPYLAEAARIHIRTGNYANLIGVLVGLLYLVSFAPHHLQDPLDAARVIGVMSAWESRTGAGPAPWTEAESTQRVFGQVTERFEPAALAQAMDEGRRMTSAEFLALVERVTTPAKGAAPLTSPEKALSLPHASLTAREREVLALVAQGMTNAQVAQELVVTPRTINAHLTAIYSKLGVVSRSGAIRYALAHQLG